MLIKPSIDELQDVMSDDRYLITTLIARRSADLAKGLKPINEEEKLPIVSQAAKEVSERLITWTDSSEGK